MSGFLYILLSKACSIFHKFKIAHAFEKDKSGFFFGVWGGVVCQTQWCSGLAPSEVPGIEPRLSARKANTLPTCCTITMGPMPLVSLDVNLPKFVNFPSSVQFLILFSTLQKPGLCFFSNWL